MKSFRRPFMSLAIICLFIGLMPYWQHVTLRGLPDGKTETKDVLTFGIPPSPLLLLERSHSEQVRDTGITTSDSKGFKTRIRILVHAGIGIGSGAHGGR